VSGSPEDVARWLGQRLRAGQIKPEKIAMAAYLGHPAAQLMGFPPPPSVRREPWDYGSFSGELLANGPVSPKIATLFGADCAARALIAHGLDYDEQEAFDASRHAVNAARGWVTGTSTSDPEAIANAMHDLTSNRYELRADRNAFQAAEVVAYGCRRQPASVAKQVINYSLSTFRQAVFGRGLNQNEVTKAVLDAGNAARDRERDWQDAHFANALLAEHWPSIPL
jgi:hypothetical protein